MSKKSPQLRFEGFTDDWEERKLKNVSTFKQGIQVDLERQYQIQNDHLIRFIRIVDYTQNTQDIRYIDINTSKNIIQPDDIIMVRYGATAGFIGRGIEGILANNMFSINPTQKIVKDYLYIYLKQDKIYKQLNNSNGSSAMPAINFSLVGNLNITYPNFEEQEKIGTFFKQLDDTIDLHQRRLDLLKEQKKGFLQKMFPKNGAKVPELRFAGFADDWEERKLSSGLREYTDRVIVEDDKEYYQISVRNNFGGITLRGSKMGNKIGRKRQAKINLTKYPQTLIFTRQTVEQGGIGWVDKYCDGAIVTENMPTISLDTSVFSKYFLTNLFQTRIFYKNAILDNIEGGSAQIAIHESKFLSSTLLFPNLDEQEKIGAFFKKIDDTLALHQRKLDLLKEQKKGFLQKMFV